MDTPSRRTWRRVVIVSHGCENVFEIVQNAFEAAENLVHCWPQRPGAAFHQALETCTAALDGRAREDEAQRSVLIAAREAKVAIAVPRRRNKWAT